MGTRKGEGGFRIKRSIKVSWTCTISWIILVQSVVLALNPIAYIFSSHIVENFPIELKSTVENWEDLPILYVSFQNVPSIVRNYIFRQVAISGILPVDLSLVTTTATTIDALKKDETIETLEPGENQLKIEFLDNEESLILRTPDNEYELPYKTIYDNPFVLSQLINSILSQKSETLGERKTGTKSLKTLYISENREPFLLRTFIGDYYFKENDTISLDDTIAVFNGNHVDLIKAGFFEENISNDIVLYYSDGDIISKEYAYKARTKNRIVFQFPVITIWDDYVVFSDGSLSDVSLTWKMKVCNTPLDVLVVNNKIYFLDITSQVVIVNAKTRRIVFSQTLEGAFSIDLSGDVLVVNTLKGKYEIQNDKDIRFIQTETTNGGENFSVIFYPSTSKVISTPFGFFYDKIFLGENVYGFWIKNGMLYLITEVGTWKIKL
ncbi:MAG: hypothetical protein ACP5PP_05465 [Fervidobacterium sp.]